MRPCDPAHTSERLWCYGLAIYVFETGKHASVIADFCSIPGNAVELIEGRAEALAWWVRGTADRMYGCAAKLWLLLRGA